MQRTRKEILTILKRKKKGTLEELAGELGLVPVTVRAHLSVLERQNLVGAEEVRGRIGRPFYVYYLTAEAEEFFPKSYDRLANLVLETVQDIGDGNQLETVIDLASSRWAEEYLERLEGKTLADRVVEVARIREEEGAMAEWQATEDGYEIVEHNCLALRVSRQHREVCFIEVGFLSKLLGSEVEQKDCILDGASLCAFAVRTANRLVEP